MSLYLLWVSFCVRQLGGHMEHNLFIMETCVDRFRPRLPMSDIQPSPKPGREKKGETGPSDRRTGDREQKHDSKGAIEINYSGRQKSCIKRAIFRTVSLPSSIFVERQGHFVFSINHTWPYHHKFQDISKFFFTENHIKLSLMNSNVKPGEMLQ